MAFNQIMDIDCRISANTFSHSVRTNYPDVFLCKTLLDAIRHILSNNSFQGSHATLTEDQEQIFEIIENLNTCPDTMFKYLRKHFAKHFDIDLYIMAFINEKFSLIHDDSYDKANVAYLLLNKDNTVQGPLYITSVNGNNETVFSKGDPDIHVDMYIYLAHLNNTKPSSDIPQIQEQQAVHCMQELIENSSIDDISNLTNQINLDAKIQFRILLKQFLQQMFRLTDELPIDAHLMNEASQQFENISVNILESILPSHPCNPTIEINYMHSTDFSTNLQYETNQIVSDGEAPLNISVPTIYGPPTLKKPLKNTFHPRNLKEFAKTRSSPIQCINSKQREALQIEVPPDDDNLLYLATELRNLDGQIHLAKVIVPDKTTTRNESLINNNDRRCLKFDKCHPDDIVDLCNNRIYSKISSQDRQALVKK
ncbi:unnamed protein product [Rotaria sp. Silwood2]|nr:unnamed protein product [Rotaria sp. Silwood2]CAF3967175.1 unnamed protein product [Rotaria sp. Silwood2]